MVGLDLARQAYAGVMTQFGTVQYGTFATAYMEAGRKLDPFYATGAAGIGNPGLLSFAGGAVAVMNLIGGGGVQFHVSVIGEKGRLDRAITYDQSPYLTGVREFTGMFRSSKSPETAQSMLTPVAVLEALEKSVASGRRVKVSSI